MNCVVIDSTQERLALAVIKDGERHRFVGDSGARRHTSEILTELDKLLSEASVVPDKLDYIGVVVGPGSFTGIRIGVATANAMAMASGAKVVEITSLEVLVHGKDKALGLIDCKHGNFYALYKDGDTTVYEAITSCQADSYEGTKALYTEPDLDATIDVLEGKILNGDTVLTAKPFYIKQSSAETESKK